MILASLNSYLFVPYLTRDLIGYATSSEANCTSSPCCRVNSSANSSSPFSALLPAPRFGAYRCDTPLALVMSALEAIPPLTNTSATTTGQGGGFDFALYTGDLVAHDADNQLSRAYVEYVETLIYDLFKKILGGVPVYAALGNHDSYNQCVFISLATQADLHTPLATERKTPLTPSATNSRDSSAGTTTTFPPSGRTSSGFLRPPCRWPRRITARIW